MSYRPLGHEPLVIYLNYPTVECSICGELDMSQWGIPVDSETGEIVANDFEGGWGGIPACRDCWKKHEDGEFVGAYPKH